MKPQAKAAEPVITPRFRIHRGGRLVFGPGRADLLEQLDRTASITEAAKAMGMSYMRAWSLVKEMEAGFAEPLVRRQRGGRTRGGATLTPTGRKVLRLYRDLEAAAEPAMRAARRRFADLFD